jgi:hypothetical protein
LSQLRRIGPILAVALLAVLVGYLVGVRGGDDGVLAGERGVREAAAEFAEVFNTYDYRSAEDHRDAVLERATGSFRSEYRDAFDQGLGQVIVDAEAVQTGFVKDVYVAAVDEERAQAIVTVDVTHSGVGGSRTIYDVYALLTFVRVDGEWKVDQVTDLNFDTAAGGSASTAEDPATTAPPTEVPTTEAVPVP